MNPVLHHVRIFESNVRYIIHARQASISQFTTIDFSTPMVEKKIREVMTLPTNDPIVEKNKSFPITTAFLSSSINSDKSGIVWLARKTGTTKSIEIPINIGKKYQMSKPSKYESKEFSNGKLTQV